MNQNTTQDFEILVKSVLQAIQQGTMDMADAHQALTSKGFNIEADISVIKDIGESIESLAKVAKSFIIFLRDILPSNKTQATLSDGEIITEKYYQTAKAFAERITKDEDHIKQFGNSGE